MLMWVALFGILGCLRVGLMCQMWDGCVSFCGLLRLSKPAILVGGRNLEYAAVWIGKLMCN